ncbi:cardiolipin synthase [bacterium]|nr:cardiolipin synthase [bacterium]
MSLSLIYIILEWIVRIIMLGVIVFKHRRNPQSLSAWLLVVIFMPWIGLLLYLAVGENRLPKRRIETHDKLKRRYDELSHVFRELPYRVVPDLGAEFKSLEKIAKHIGQMPILGAERVEIISDSTESIDKMIADIDRAEHHVHLLFYIYRDDETGTRMNEALKRAADRGVQCRLLVDSVGASSFVKSHKKWMRENGIEFHEALPVRAYRRKLQRFDLRNHRKLVIIDGTIAYTGSQNIADRHYGYKDRSWYDVMARMSGSVVLSLQWIFLVDWYFESKKMLFGSDLFPIEKMSGTIPVQTIPSGPSYPTGNYKKMVIDGINSALEEVLITSPYFVPDMPIIEAIEIAILRDVKIKLILPEKSDQFWVDTASRSFYREFLEMGVEIYRYQGGIPHAKMLTIDQTIAFFGTSNFDTRSFELNYEVNLIFYDEAITRSLIDIQESYIQGCKLLSLDEWIKRPIYTKVLQNVTKIISPLL